MFSLLWERGRKSIVLLVAAWYGISQQQSYGQDQVHEKLIIIVLFVHEARHCHICVVAGEQSVADMWFLFRRGC